MPSAREGPPQPSRPPASGVGGDSPTRGPPPAARRARRPARGPPMVRGYRSRARGTFLRRRPGTIPAAVDNANKRTAFLSTAHYLLKNGFLLTKSERELEDFTVEIAERGLRKYPRYRDLCKNRYSDPEVRYISWYLRKHSRRSENSHHTITYRDLDTILKSFDCFLSNPSGNRIDVNKRIKKRRFFGKGYREDVTRVCRIGFPGWSKQVSKGDIKYLRGELELTPKDGIDSAAFYKNADDIRGLIASYEGALKRLAFR